MMTKNADKKREQMMMFSMDSMVPQDHMLRLIDKAINWNFIYDLVEDKYCQNNGRPSMDPVMLVKIPFIQYLYGIKSMRQTIREIEVNVAYRWFLGKNGLLNGQKRRFLRNFWIQFNFKGKNGAGMIPAPSLSTVCNYEYSFIIFP